MSLYYTLSDKEKKRIHHRVTNKYRDTVYEVHSLENELIVQNLKVNQFRRNNTYCIGYARVSTPEQKSLNAQISELKRYAETLGYKSMIVFRVEGSAWSVNSIYKMKSFNEMIHLLECSCIDTVFINDISRFMRNTLIASKFLNEVFVPNNCRIYSIIDNVIWDHNRLNQTKFMDVILQSEKSSTLLSEKMKKSANYRARLGNHVGGIKYGYKRIDHGGIKKLVKCDKESKVLGYIKNLRGASYYPDYKNICKKLNDMGIQKRNREFTPGMVRDICKTKEYEESEENDSTGLGSYDNWIQCDRCNKWRKITENIYNRFKDNTFYCENIECMNCNIPQEVDVDELDLYKLTI